MLCCVTNKYNLDLQLRVICIEEIELLLNALQMKKVITIRVTIHIIFSCV